MEKTTISKYKFGNDTGFVTDDSFLETLQNLRKDPEWEFHKRKDWT